MNTSKPIFIVFMPSSATDELMEFITLSLNSNIELQKDYHVLTTMGYNDYMEFKCFNSPYSEEEYKKLEDLIEKIKIDYDKIERPS